MANFKQVNVIELIKQLSRRVCELFPQLAVFAHDFCVFLGGSRKKFISASAQMSQWLNPKRECIILPCAQ